MTKNNRLNNFRRILLVCLAAFGVMVLLLFLFEKDILALANPYLSMDGDKTTVYYHDLYQLMVFELIWGCGVISIALLFYSTPSIVSGIDKLEKVMADRPKQFLLVVIAIFSIVILGVTFFVLQEFPNSSDEYVYLYQGESMSRGKLYEESHPVDKSFGFNHIALKDGVAVGRFPPGWPVIISIFYFLGIPVALANPILAILSLFVFYHFSKKLYGGRIAGWSLLLLAFTGFFVFNSSSYFSHTTCLLAALIFVYCVYLFLESGKIKYGLIAGIAIGLLVITRYYTAILLFLPFGILLLYQFRMKAMRLFVVMGFGMLPFLLFFFWYNFSITGNALEPVTVWAYHGEGLGFVNGHTIFKSMEHIVRRCIMFVYWCSPVLLFLYFYLLIGKFRDKKSRMIVPEDYLFLVLIVGYMLYYEIGGNQYGPRFYYEALPFLILFIVHKIFRENKYWAKVLLCAGLLIAIVKLPFIAHREYKIIEERNDVYRLVDEKKIDHAVILLSSGTSVTRPMPSGDLTRNDRAFTNDVLFAIDHIHANPVLMKYYKDRKFYRYVRDPEKSKGTLVRIR